MTTAAETITILIPRLPARRDTTNPARFERWKEWLHAVKVYARLRLADGNWNRCQLRKVEGPCFARAVVRYHGTRDGDELLLAWADGIYEAIVRSGIAPDLGNVYVNWRRAGSEESIMTSIDIFPEGR